MNRYTKIKYNCRHTTYLIEKKQYGYLGPRDFIEMYIHLITCPFCRLYKKQTKVIANFLHQFFKMKDPAALDITFKQRLQQMIEDRLDQK